MTSIENRLLSLNLGTSASPLSDFLKEFAKDPYREFVQYRLRSFSPRNLQDAALDDWAVAADTLGLPAELEGLARASATLKARFLVDPGYWSGFSARSCADAFTDIVNTVAVEIDLATIWNDTRMEELSASAQRVLLGLFMFASNLFAGQACESRLIRRQMGIRKSFFG